ncbi:SKP1-like protein 6 [Phragmites australis]|uniref:SKP1-like protein 6 n=1 Tax=Phragmites australis TaxID=29695 RepID=UPI002D773DF8|nr:SKP1-like protein 6 [Phragmites australis]
MSPSAEKKPADDSTTTFAVAEEEKVVLCCSDGVEFVVDVSVTKMSGMISNMIDDECVEGGVPLPNVEGQVMSRVLEYLGKKHGSAAAEDFKKFKSEFLEELVADKKALFDVILAANYLHTQELLDTAF